MKAILMLSALLSAGETDVFLKAVAQVESKGNPFAVGDNGKAYGLYQIRQEYLDEVYRLVGRKAVVARWGEELRLNDLVNPEKARWVVEVWLGHYGTLWGKLGGKKGTNCEFLEYLARCHNGGPSGWRKKATEKYWKKVEKELGVVGKCVS